VLSVQIGRLTISKINPISSVQFTGAWERRLGSKVVVIPQASLIIAAIAFLSGIAAMVLYYKLLPRPISGIPYKNSHAQRIFGEVSEVSHEGSMLLRQKLT